MGRDLAANLAGRAWSTAMAVAFVPFYIKFMGIEAYGVVGLFATIQTLSTLLDLGLSSALGRELAQSAGEPPERRRDLIRTLEAIYWPIGGVLAIAIALAAGPLAAHWVHERTLPEATIATAGRILALTLFLQWPSSLYGGGLLGIGQHPLYNALTALAATVRGAGAVLVLWLVSPTLTAFLTWQVIAAAFQTLVLGPALWRQVRAAHHRPTISRSELRRVWRFAAGLSAISIVTLALTNADRVLLSRILPLDAFGYYTLAWVVAGSLYAVSGPVHATVYPKLCAAVIGDRDAERSLYHLASETMAVLIAPLAATVVFFAPELLRAWTGNAAIAAQTETLVRWLIVGTALNALVTVPYALQLAHGWTGLTLKNNAIALATLVPLIWLLVPSYGAVAAAWSWVVLNGCYLLITVGMMHARLLQGEHAAWLRDDVARPVAVAFATVAVLWVASAYLPFAMRVAVAVAAAPVALAATAAGSKRVSVKLRGALASVREPVLFDRLEGSRR
jgi:O-antigen/teichoic acid export membrane protein